MPVPSTRLSALAASTKRLVVSTSEGSDHEVEKPLTSGFERLRARTPSLVAGVAIAALVLAIQWWTGAFRGELVHDSDEPAHFTSGMLVYDYLHSGNASPPLEFAQEYYVRFPKVAIGHWPPGFYVLQAFWYTLVGPGKTSAILLSGLAVALTALALFVRFERLENYLLSALLVLLFIFTPLIVDHSTMVMADIIVLMFGSLAGLAFIDYLREGRGSQMSWFVVFATAALLTRPAAATLIIFAGLAPIATFRLSRFCTRSYWAGMLTIIVLTAPYYLVTMNAGMGLHSHKSAGAMVWSATAPSQIFSRLAIFENTLGVAAPAVYVLAGLGVLAAIFRRQQHDQRLTAAASLAWVAAILGFHLLAPIKLNIRYLLPILTPLILLAGEGLFSIHAWCTARSRWLGAVVPCAVVVLTIALADYRTPECLSGYGAAAASIPSECAEPVVLISSDPTGEGAFVVERLLRDRARSGFVLRGSKMLSHSNWSGRRYRLLYDSTSEVRQFLNETPVHFIVLDEYAFRRNQTPAHHDLLRETIANSPESFPLLARHEFILNGQQQGSWISVYENLAARGRPPDSIQIDMQTSLGERIEWQRK